MTATTWPPPEPCAGVGWRPRSAEAGVQDHPTTRQVDAPQPVPKKGLPTKGVGLTSRRSTALYPNSGTGVADLSAGTSLRVARRIFWPGSPGCSGATAWPCRC